MEATYSVIEQTADQLTIHQSETDRMCAGRYFLTADGEIKDVRGYKLSKNAASIRGAIYSLARQNGFKYTPKAGVYF